MSAGVELLVMNICHTRIPVAAAALVCASFNMLSASDIETVESKSIREHRMGTLIVRASPGAIVKVRQTSHEFWFGAALSSRAFNGGMDPADAARYRDVFLENFNSAVTENAVKWLAMERRRGEVNYSVVDAILEWADSHDIPVRGHNIFWGVPKWTQQWVQDLDDEVLLATVEARARDIGRRYRGRFAEYDLNNEMIHGNVFAERLGADITLKMAQWVRDEDPQAILFLNDYDILTGARLDDYVAHIRELLAMGVPIGGIGVQGHLHTDTFDPAALRNALDVLARLGLPIRVTEFNLPGQRSRFYENRSLGISSQEEKAKAAAIVDYYRICFAHPAVTGILMWGFWEGANWIPQSSLFKRDWTPTPAAQAYRDLVFGEWWTTWEGVADDDGRAEIPAFFGTFEVSAGGSRNMVQLRKSDGSATVTFP